MSFTTHRYIQKLVDAGFDESQAKAIAEVTFEMLQHSKCRDCVAHQAFQYNEKQPFSVSPNVLIAIPILLSLLALTITVYKHVVM